MTNEKCIARLNGLIESRKRLKNELRHKGARSWVIQEDIEALEYAIKTVCAQQKLDDQLTGVENAIKAIEF